jgi:hypothetical protein
MYHKSQAMFQNQKNRLKTQLLIYHLKLCFMAKIHLMLVHYDARFVAWDIAFFNILLRNGEPF